MLPQLPSNVTSGQRRTGPVGRLARVGLFVIFAGSLYSIVDDQGSARFRNPHILSEPSAWLLHVTLLIVFVVLVGILASALVGTRRVLRVQIAAVAALLLGCAVAAIAGKMTFGSVWGFPLSDLVWWFDVLMLAVGLASTALATVLGTPGCEIAVLGEFAARFRLTPACSPQGFHCVVGLHALDSWERRRAARPSSGEPSAVAGTTNGCGDLLGAKAVAQALGAPVVANSTCERSSITSSRARRASLR